MGKTPCADYGAYQAALPAGLPVEKHWNHTLDLPPAARPASNPAFLPLCFLQHEQGDYFVNPDVRYSFTDRAWSALGANAFGGQARGIGQLSQDDNIYLQLRYEF